MSAVSRARLRSLLHPLAVLVVGLVIVAGSASLLHAADIAAGKARAEVCSACHGETGVSLTEKVPSLAGQPDTFLQWQLVFFRAGTRKDEAMQAVVADLGNEDIRNLGAYYASLPAPAGSKDDRNPELMKAGAEAAMRGRCASCHLEHFTGDKGTARLAGQREDYLAKALHDYKAGVRSGGAMATMANLAFSLSDDDITALAHFLAHQ